MPAPFIPDQFTERGGLITRAGRLFLQWFSDIFRGTPAACTVTWGTGSPETVVSAPVGSLFLRTNGGASTTLYVKESGTGNTGWVGK
jgi:hypothetical protein